MSLGLIESDLHGDKVWPFTLRNVLLFLFETPYHCTSVLNI